MKHSARHTIFFFFFCVPGGNCEWWAAPPGGAHRSYNPVHVYRDMQLKIFKVETLLNNAYNVRILHFIVTDNVRHFSTSSSNEQRENQDPKDEEGTN